MFNQIITKIKMKQIKYLAFLLAAGTAFTACDDENELEPQETVDPNLMTLTFEGGQWDALIDSPQYNGPLLYGDNAKNYAWLDTQTQLTGGMTNAWGGQYGFSEGGIAISNYIDANIGEPRDFNDQLAVPVGNGSKNFAVVYCDASLKFADGVAREIVSMDVIGTTYLLGVIKNGDGYAKAMTEKGDYVNVIINAYNGDTQVGTTKIALSANNGFLTKWYTKPLSELGKITRLDFAMESNDVSEWGMKAPKYFAFDNVVVRKP